MQNKRNAHVKLRLKKTQMEGIRGSNAKIQTQVVMGGEGARGVNEEPRALLKCKV
jgi:hypothetical protein